MHDESENAQPSRHFLTHHASFLFLWASYFIDTLSVYMPVTPGPNVVAMMR
jgi:hypothetical protein